MGALSYDSGAGGVGGVDTRVRARRVDARLRLELRMFTLPHSDGVAFPIPMICHPLPDARKGKVVIRHCLFESVDGAR